MSGVAVVVSDAKSIAVVNVIGPIDIDLLMELSGKLNIPRIDIETEKKDKQRSLKRRAMTMFTKKKLLIVLTLSLLAFVFTAPAASAKTN